jgi:sorting nexin-4
MDGQSTYDTNDFSEGRLECTVSQPQKELDGTKDAYISYLVSTKVRGPPIPF